MPIPQSLGGEGRGKLDYALLTSNAQRLADVAISLTIQANTSIGTTPILLARDRDLPLARKDLGPFVSDAVLQHVTLLQQMKRALDTKSDHAMPLEFFRDILDEHFSEDEVNQQIDTALNWGRYAEIFAYDDDSGTFNLENPT